ncbi:MAG: DUF535 family protein [Burkholderiales bacterium]|nr:DUF535 family protein [Burkholderiales bacterium]
MTSASANRVPGIWQGISWALNGAPGGGVSRPRLLWRALNATLAHPKVMRRWMAMVFELNARGIAADMPGEYLRAIRPYVNRHTGVTTRVRQLVDHADWLETALQPSAFSQISSGEPLVLAELPAPRGYEYMRLQLQRSSPQSPEGELLLTLTLRRAAEVQPNAQPVDAAAMGFSRFRVDDVACLVIGGVRGQRNPVTRLSPQEISQALSGWKPAVLMVRVAQELARFWNLRLIGLDPTAHQLQGWTYRWNSRHRDAAVRIYDSYGALWDHFEATKGPHGWMILPLNSDEKLAATALSPEKRSRQTRRADYWIRTRNQLRLQFRELLLRPGREARLSRVTESMGRDSADEDDGDDFMNSEDMVPSRVLETGPGSLL